MSKTIYAPAPKEVQARLVTYLKALPPEHAALHCKTAGRNVIDEMIKDATEGNIMQIIEERK